MTSCQKFSQKPLDIPRIAWYYRYVNKRGQKPRR
nr:MAG TPA: Terpene synthase metal-binding domain-containing protein, cyclase, terpenoid, induced fit [Caudoviricetes sp.]